MHLVYIGCWLFLLGGQSVYGKDEGLMVNGTSSGLGTLANGGTNVDGDWNQTVLQARSVVYRDLEEDEESNVLVEAGLSRRRLQVIDKIIGENCTEDSKINIRKLPDEFEKALNQFLNEKAGGAFKDKEIAPDVLTRKIPFVGSSIEDFIGDGLETMKGWFNEAVSQLGTDHLVDTNSCFGSTRDGTIYGNCTDEDSFVEVALESPGVKVTFCPIFRKTFNDITLNTAGIFDAIEDFVEVDINGGDLKLEASAQTSGTVVFTLDKRIPKFKNATFDPFQATLSLESTDSLSVTVGLGMVDLSSTDTTARASVTLFVDSTTGDDDKPIPTFELDAGYSLEGKVGLSTGLKGLEDLPSSAKFTITELDVFDPKPVVDLDAEGFNFKEFMSFGPKSAITMLHFVDSALVRSQENELMNVLIPTTTTPLSEVLATGSVFTSRYV